VIDKVSRYFSK